MQRSLRGVLGLKFDRFSGFLHQSRICCRLKLLG
jgi:hypothetical protein